MIDSEQEYEQIFVDEPETTCIVVEVSHIEGEQGHLHFFKRNEWAAYKALVG